MSDKIKSIKDVAFYMNVSIATIKNWIKCGYLNPVSTNPIFLKEEEVFYLNNRIKSGDIIKLRKYNNKTVSKTTSIPIEYVNNISNIKIIDSIVNFINIENMDVNISLFFITLKILELNKEVKFTSIYELFNINFLYDWKRNSVKNEMYDWYSILEQNNITDKYIKLFNYIEHIIEDDDILGILYQSLHHEGNKSIKGSYYTPKNIVETSLIDNKEIISSFLDPCCGTGQYLICVIKKFNLSLNNVYGFDNDKIATYIARINLLIAFPHIDIRPNIECLDSIVELANESISCSTNALLNNIDYIATNPPWGAYLNKDTYLNINSCISSNETFSLFLEKSLKLIKDGGKISFILPESILMIKIHADIRKLLLNKTSIISIIKLGRKFSGVFTSAICLNLIKKFPKKDHFISIEENNKIKMIKQSKFLLNKHFTFNINTTCLDDEVITKLYKKSYITLANNSNWALGIVTGNNNKYILDTPNIQTEPIYKGKDVDKYFLKSPNNYIIFTPEQFQQVAKIEFYRAKEKIIYKFISKNLIFAYDNKQCLTLNSANILIPNLIGYSTKTVLAFLNSNIFQYIFSKKLSTHKILRSDLETLPFPFITHEIDKKIERIVDEIIIEKKINTELDKIIYELFELSSKDIFLIENYKLL